MRRISAFLAGALITGSVLAACGGGDEVTKADYIKKADKICEASKAEMDKLGDPTTEEEFNALVPKAIQIERDQIKALRALDTPKADGETLKSLFDQVEEATNRIEDNPSVLFSGTEDPFAASSKAAGDYGFRVCGGD